MLYDPKWETQTGLAGFIAWLERQDPTTKYDFRDPQTCALGRYATATGRAPQNATPSAADALQIPYSENFHRVVMNKPWTLGAALKRARKFASGC